MLLKGAYAEDGRNGRVETTPHFGEEENEGGAPPSRNQRPLSRGPRSLLEQPRVWRVV